MTCLSCAQECNKAKKQLERAEEKAKQDMHAAVSQWEQIKAILESKVRNAHLSRQSVLGAGCILLQKDSKA